MQEKEIKIKVVLDDRNTPESIFWQADDQPGTLKGYLVRLFCSLYFDKEHLDTFKLDLWTKDLQVNEMDKFMFQTLRGLVDTYYKATNNGELANELQRFVHYFGEKTGIIEPESED